MRLYNLARAVGALTLLSPTLFPQPALAIELDPAQPDQVRKAAKNVAEVLISMYADTANNRILSGIPGLLTYPPYYWWQAGAMFGQLIDYWYYTNDSTWNELVREGIMHQSWGGNVQNFMPANQSKAMGNDDQLFWGFTVMSAAEYNFPNPPSDQLGWLGLAQGIFNQLASRWDAATCGGGVRWQVYQWLQGYEYKNIAANGGFFQLGARLALYTGNHSYAEKAEEVFAWLENTSPLITDDYQILDGTNADKGCIKPDPRQWTYNYGIMLGGAAYMYKYTNGSEFWAKRLEGFINQTDRFFPDGEYRGVMMELCEPSQKCNIDQVSFKGYLSRWFAVAVQLAPFTAPKLMKRLQESGKAAAQTCVGTWETSSLPYACGNRWYKDGYDGNGGAGQQLAALSIISANLISQAPQPFRAGTGGTSQGNPGAGSGGHTLLEIEHPEVTTADRAGAWILTILMCAGTVAGGWWLVTD